MTDLVKIEISNKLDYSDKHVMKLDLSAKNFGQFTSEDKKGLRIALVKISDLKGFKSPNKDEISYIGALLCREYKSFNIPQILHAKELHDLGKFQEKEYYGKLTSYILSICRQYKKLLSKVRINNATLNNKTQIKIKQKTEPQTAYKSLERMIKNITSNYIGFTSYAECYQYIKENKLEATDDKTIVAIKDELVGILESKIKNEKMKNLSNYRQSTQCDVLKKILLSKRALYLHCKKFVCIRHFEKKLKIKTKIEIL